MDAILPIQNSDPISVRSIQGTPSVSPQPSIDPQDVLPLDPNRLENDPRYAVQTLDVMLRRARRYYQQGQYALAEGLFENFFRYLKNYRLFHLFRIPYIYSAILELAVAKQVLTDRKAATEFLNRQLLFQIEAVQQSTQAEAAQEQIRMLQEQALLPSPTRLTVEPSAEALERVAAQLQSTGQSQLALPLLAHAGVLTQLRLNRIQQGIASLDSDSPPLPIADNLIRPQAVNAYQHWGLPIAPVLPITPEDAQRIRDKRITLQQHVEYVEPIYPLNKAPDERDRERRRRRAKQKAMGKQSDVSPASPKGPRKKNPNVNPKRKPSITL